MRITTNKIFLILLVLAVAGALAYAFMPKPVAVDLAPVVRGPLAVTVAEDGKTRIKDRYVVAAPLSGRLVRIELKAGNPVEAGKTLLASIEPIDPELLDVRARAEAAARANAAQSNYQLARVKLERMQKLAAQQLIARQDLDDANNAAQVARFELEQAQAALLRTRGDRGAKAGRFEIRAPISGRVLRVLQESSLVVAPGTPLLELGDPANLEVEVDLLSTDAVKIAPGAKAFLEHWGGQDPLMGRVRLVEPAGFTKISALGVEEQRVWVKIDFTDPPEKRSALGDAYRVEARIVIWQGDNVVQVPAGALFRQGGDWAVFIAKDGRARRRLVKIAHNNGLAAEVLEGLGANDRVILYPSDRVQDGMSVVSR